MAGLELAGLVRICGGGQVERGAEARAAPPVWEPEPRGHAEGEDGAEVGREREAELGLGAGELRVGEAWEDGDPGRAEVGEHSSRHGVEGVRPVSGRRSHRS